MAIKSVYIPEPWIEGGLIRIRDDEHRHLSVARAGVDERIEVFDGKGHVWDAAISAIDRRETVVRVTASRVVAPDRHELILGQSLIRSSSFEVAIEKAVETGVTRIVPVTAARSNVKDVGRRERWHKVIVEAAKQSKRYHLPVLDEPMPFAKVITGTPPAVTKILFAERNGTALKPAIQGSPVLYLIGPEGGWTDTEVNSAALQGFALIELGPTILRSETAAAVATFIIRYELDGGS